jgi:hypothetical protein
MAHLLLLQNVATRLLFPSQGQSSLDFSRTPIRMLNEHPHG